MGIFLCITLQNYATSNVLQLKTLHQCPLLVTESLSLPQMCQWYRDCGILYWQWRTWTSFYLESIKFRFQNSKQMIGRERHLFIGKGKVMVSLLYCWYQNHSLLPTNSTTDNCPAWTSFYLESIYIGRPRSRRFRSRGPGTHLQEQSIVLERPKTLIKKYYCRQMTF